MSLVTIERHGNIAVVSIDHPPINAGNVEQRGARLNAITTQWRHWQDWNRPFGRTAE